VNFHNRTDSIVLTRYLFSSVSMKQVSLWSALSITLLLVGGSLRAQTTEVSGRAHVFDFLDIITNPRSAAMGNSGVSIKNDPNGLFANPATISTLARADSSAAERALSVGFTKYILDINEGYLSYVQSLPDSSGTIGAGVQFMDYGTFQGYNMQGLPTGTFGAEDVALSVAYSNIARHDIHYGVTVKFISSNLVTGSSMSPSYSSSGVAVDAGLFYDFEPALMTFGASVLNAGTQLSTYAGVRESLPLDVTVGLSKKLERLPFTAYLAFHHLTRDLEGHSFWFALNDFNLGGEFALGKVVRLRFGYQNQLRRDLTLPGGSGLAGFSVGLGIVIKQYQFDYSFNSMGLAFQPLNRLGVSVFFN
jgi:hypothetical protein